VVSEEQVQLVRTLGRGEGGDSDVVVVVNLGRSLARMLRRTQPAYWTTVAAAGIEMF
jgi:hypothetical protein